MNLKICLILLIFCLTACSDDASPVSSSKINPTATVSSATLPPLFTPSITISPGRTSLPVQTIVATKPLFSRVSTKDMLGWAELLVQNLTSSDTDYQHTNGVVTWAGEHGATKYESRTDCSGFISALLTQTYGLSREEFGKWLGKTRPLAISFYEAIALQRGFTRVDNILEMKPGDIIAIKYPNPAPGDNTGHLMLVAGVARQRTATKPIVSNTEQWELEIIDSSSSGHGKQDTRHQSDGTFSEGVGKGSLRLYTTSGKVTGYSWSLEGESEYYPLASRPLIIGKLDSKFIL